RRVLVTTTTHMGLLPEDVTGPVFVQAEGTTDEELRGALQSRRLATLLGRRVRPDKIAGVSGAEVDALRDAADLVLVEADGARGRVPEQGGGRGVGRVRAPDRSTPGAALRLRGGGQRSRGRRAVAAMIAALLLAAGGSRRMGRPKLLAPVPGGTLLGLAASAL